MGDRTLVHAGDCRPDFSRPYDPPVKHLRYAYVMDKFEFPRRQRDSIQRRNGFAENLPLRGSQPLCGRAEWNVELFASDEFLIRDTVASLSRNDAIRDGKLVGRFAPKLCRHTDECFPGCRCCLSQVV